MKKIKNLLLIIFCLIMVFTSCDNEENFQEADFSNYKLVLTPIEELTRHDIFNSTVTVYYSDNTTSDHVLVVQSFGRHSFFNVPEGAVKIEASVFFENGKRVKIELFNSKGEIVEERVIIEQPYLYTAEI